MVYNKKLISYIVIQYIFYIYTYYVMKSNIEN